MLQYESWFEALESMYRKIDEIDFDIALVAGGAYGMFLANLLSKKVANKLLHVAGALQLLFRIRGGEMGGC